MKTVNAIFTILIFALPAPGNSQSQAPAPAQVKETNAEHLEAWKAAKQHEAELKSGKGPGNRFANKTPFERHRILSEIRGSRKFDVSPVKQVDGIKTGVVMVYGHIIPAPYKIEYVGNKMFVNGIQVQPSLVRERDQKAHPIKTLPPEKIVVEQKAGKVIRDAKKMYEEGKGNKSVDILHKQILDNLGKHADLIHDPVWQAETLCYKTPNYSFRQCVNFGPSMLAPSEAQEQRAAAAKKDELKMIETELNAGKMLCFGSENTWVPKRDMRAEVNRIMRNSSLSVKQKIDALKTDVFGSYVLAEDVVDNYTTEEWAIGERGE